MKKIICSIALLFCAGFANAQNMAYYKAQEHINKDELSEAAEILEKALVNPKTTQLAKMYNLAGNVHARIFNPELLKAAQGLPLDTAVFVSELDKTIAYYTKSHEYDMQPNKKGKVKPEFQADNFKMVKSMLDYYNYAAQFLYANKNYEAASEYFQKYVDMPKNPVFSAAQTDSIYAAKHKEYAQAAFNVVMINYQGKNWDGVLQTVDAALKDTAQLQDLYLMKMQAQLAKKDSAAYLNTLKEAVSRVESNANFAQNLLYYYVNKNDLSEAEAMANDMIAKNPNSKVAWYMKGCVELNMKKDFEAAKASFEKSLAIDSNYADANINMGITYINEVVARRNNGEFCLDRTKVKEFNADYEKIKVYYEKAKPYFEKIRELLPDQPKVWAPYLSNIYTNLQMKSEAEAMDALLKEANAQ